MTAVALGAVSLTAAAVTWVTAGGSAAATRAPGAQTVLGAGQTGTRAQVPWSKVGPGWELAEYTAKSLTGQGPTMLYLFAPTGGRYLMYTWPAKVLNPFLVDWSGDKTRALLIGLTPTQATQLTLATGKISSFNLAGGGQVLGYTRPDGLNILGFQMVGGTDRLARFSLTGKLVKVLAGGAYPGYTSAIYSSDGTEIATEDSKGLVLVSNAGGIIRRLPVLNQVDCAPTRWWNASTIVASCVAPNSARSRVWLVPVSGARPTALTPQRGSSSHDLGDFDAWRLTSGLYLQAAGPCGAMQIFKQSANGSITPVVVPRTAGNDNWIVTATGSRMLLRAQTACPGTISLLWYNLATHAEQWLIKAPAGAEGVLSVVAYYSRQNAG